MDITRRCDYACRMLRAVCSSTERISVADIAKAEDIPYSFARSIQHDLVKAGFLRTVRGARGGVSLARDLHAITVLDVLRAVEGSVAVSPCSEDPAYCTRSGCCVYHRVWCGADRLLEDYFGSITLADLFPEASAAPSTSDAAPVPTAVPAVLSKGPAALSNMSVSGDGAAEDVA